MLITNLTNIIMEYGDRTLFSIPSLSVYQNEKIGIVGENGAGKTTLIDIIAKSKKSTCGSVY